MDKQREKSLKEYYENPNRCLHCNKIIEVKENKKVSVVRKKKFCNSSCSASFNNNVKPKREAKPVSNCLNCGELLSNNVKKYCDVNCQHEYEYKTYIQKWKAGEVDGSSNGGWGRVSGHIRRYLFEKYDSKCSRCGWGETNPYTKTIPLEVEHIDGNYKNNCEENLTLLCPNCHSLTETYRGANKGNGRPITWSKKI